MLAACGGGGDDDSGGTGTLSVSMTDAPACGFDHVFVTVDKIRVHTSANAEDGAGGWAEIDVNPSRRIDLLSLQNGTLTKLGQTVLPAGQYQQIRLVLDRNTGNALANSVVPTGGAEQPLDTPSATQSGYKIIRPFTVQRDTLVDLVLDFDACRSIVQRGNGSYALKPVVTAVPLVVSGAIQGYVSPAQAGATVYAQQNGVTIKGTLADSNGAFTLSPLLRSSDAGSYSVVVVQNDRATGVIQNVPVAAQATTTVSTSAAPITLPASPMRRITGSVLPAAAQASVHAKQNVAGAPIEVAVANANFDTGAYQLNVPNAAPLAGTYQPTLPIVLSADTAAAGRYTVTATSITGATLSTDRDVSAADATANFQF
ncbi:hypothetical protein B551_0224605 [Cupriavidus sp. HPC(L)]|nr:hypothetical protein B551_0224605 [Cupriavidus sp. HPC(L)]